MQRHKNRMHRPLRRVIALIQHRAPRIEQPSRNCPVGNFVPQIIRYSAVGVDALEVRPHFARQKERRHMKVLVVRRRKLAAPCLRLVERGPLQRRQILRREPPAARAASQSRRSPRHPARENCGFDLPRAPIPAHHARKDRRHLVQSRSTSDVLRALEPATRHQFERRAARCRSMVKTCLQRDIAIVQPVRVQLHLRPARRPAKEVDDAALPHHLDRPLPRRRSGNRLDHNIGASPFRCQGAGRSHHIDRRSPPARLRTRQTTVPRQSGPCASPRQSLSPQPALPHA